jgi:biotin operon repressor
MTDTASDARTFHSSRSRTQSSTATARRSALRAGGVHGNRAPRQPEVRLAFPGMATIARETGMSRNRVVAAVKKLETTGLIRVNRRKRDDGGKASNEYTLVNATTLVPPQTPEPQTTTATDAPPCISEIHGDVSTEYIPCIPQIQEQDESNRRLLTIQIQKTLAHPRQAPRLKHPLPFRAKTRPSPTIPL